MQDFLCVSIYSNHLNTGQAWYSNDPNVFGSQMVWFSNGGLKTGQKCLFFGQNVQFTYGPPNHMIRLFKNPTIKCPKSHIFGFKV